MSSRRALLFTQFLKAHSPKGNFEFPQQIHGRDRVFHKLHQKDKNFPGLNLKDIYVDKRSGTQFVAKVEKKRHPKEIMNQSIPDISKANQYQGHVNTLRDAAAATSVIASLIAKAIFPSFVIPTNLLVCLDDGMPVVLSEWVPLDEFLSKTNVIKNAVNKILEQKCKPNPDMWTQCPKREDLKLTNPQAKVLGKIFYAALLMAHWDPVNNIDLTNSGCINKDGELVPSMVDWGDSFSIGFGGLSQDATAFRNKELFGFFDEKTTVCDQVKGFSGTVPFDVIVYPHLPRQVIRDLFKMTGKDEISKMVLAGFREAHEEARKNISHLSASKAVEKALETVPEKFRKKFADALDFELFEGATPGVEKILRGRFKSIEVDILPAIFAGKSMNEIARLQLEKIRQSQQVESKKSIFTSKL